MPGHATGLAAGGLVLSLAVAALGLQQTQKELSIERGASAYRFHCAVCHGEKAEGDGPMAPLLRFAPPDLTRLAKRNKGRYDVEMVQRIIDGRFPIKGHGGPEMPIWGDAFLEPREGYSKDGVRRKIVDLAAFLATLQR